jgi:hypothetical protein
MHLHHVNVQKAAHYLGDIVVCTLHDGKFVYGRVDAVDEWKVYLGRAQPPNATDVKLHDVKEIDYYRGPESLPGTSTVTPGS